MNPPPSPPLPRIFAYFPKQALAGSRSHAVLLACYLALPCLVPVAVLAAEPTLPPEQLEFFEKKVRPVLANSCYDCHSAQAKAIKGGLALDTRDGIRQGGNSGPAVVPGNLEDSLLIEAVRYHTSDMAMPPRKQGGKLPDQAIADLEAWVKMGAPDPRENSAKLDAVVSSKKWSDYTEATKWWSWQLPQQAAIPAAASHSEKFRDWSRGPIDDFILTGLEAKNLHPVADADPASLLRRVYFDLVGLPPRPSEVTDFVSKCRKEPNGSWHIPQELLAGAIDMLLATPQFGERWGRHWLDVARYAESSGKDVNVSFPHAWRYRDYVIAAFNQDKSYATFIREQIAGDLLESTDAADRAEKMVATGFLALGTKSMNEQNTRQFALDLADEQIDTLGQAFLATTISCARCHDHKFDPIPQKEYYALAGIFLSTNTHYGTANGIQNRHATELLELPTACGQPPLPKTLSQEQMEAKKSELAGLIEERNSLFRGANGMGPGNQNAADNLKRLRTIARIGQLEVELKSYDNSGNSKLLAMGVQDMPSTKNGGGGGGAGGKGAQGGQGLVAGIGEMFRKRLQARFGRPQEFSFINNSPLYLRGDVDKPSDRVQRGFLSVMTKTGSEALHVPEGTSGRKELADWLVSPGNPLTSRVMVNRVWSWLFGEGLVTSTDNFGTTGKLPSHPELLDHLALKFSSHWSVKKLIREIMLTRTYQLSADHDEANFKADPDNSLCWQHRERRLDAECLRDAMLCISGEIDLRPVLGSEVAQAGDVVIGQPRFRGGLSEDSLHEPNGSYRSVYLPIVRDNAPDVLALFDFAESSLVTGSRDSTNVPSQALFMLNSDFVAMQAKAFAQKILDAYPGGKNASAVFKLEERLRWAYGLCFSRWPTSSETQAAQNFLQRLPDKEPKTAWTSLCRSLFGTAEFRLLR